MGEEQKDYKHINVLTIWKYFWMHVKVYKWTVLIAFLSFALAGIFAGVIRPVLFQKIVDTVINGVAHGEIPLELYKLFFDLVFVSVAFSALYRIGDYSVSYSQSKILDHLQIYTFQRMLVHSKKFFANTFTGSLVAKTKRFVRSFEVIYDTMLWHFWSFAVQIVGIFIVVFRENKLLGWLFLGWIVVFTTTTLILVKYKTPLDVHSAAMDSKVTAVFADALTNILTIKIFSQTKYERKYFDGVSSDQERARRKVWNFDNFRNLIQGFLMVGVELVAIWIAIKLWADGSISAGVIVLIQLYLSRIFDGTWGLSHAIVRFTQAIMDAKEVVDVFEQTPDILDPENPEKAKMENGHVKFEQVDFQYDEGVKVFSKFNLDIPSGQTVGLVGHSGSGKSTLTDLLLRFTDVTAGAITIDGQDIRNVTQDDLRRHISYVPQDPILFHRTIKENISYGKPRATKAEIIEAAKKAKAHDFILALPLGYDTMVGERGVKLSGGQRQRVAIARVMLENASILLLDEATSSLDSISETHIQEAFMEAMKGRTTIVIAHRLSTVAHLDRIIVLSDGKIVEDDTHQKSSQEEIRTLCRVMGASGAGVGES